MERQEWSGLRLDLENKLKEARTINESMHVELEKLRAVNGGLERDLRVQQQQESSVIKGDDSGLKREYEDLEKRHEELKLDLHEQQQVISCFPSSMTCRRASAFQMSCKLHFPDQQVY